MNEIKKLVRIVTKRIKKNVSLIDVISHDDNPNKEQLLFNNIQSGSYQTDEDASRDMYGTGSADPRYRMLKSRLRYKLYNLLFFTEYNDTGGNIGFPYEQECLSYIYRAKVLHKEGEYELAEKHVNKALTISREAEFTDITLSGLWMLRSIYAELCRPNHLRKTIGRIKKYEDIHKLEQEAYNIFYMKIMQLRKSIHSRKVHFDSTVKAVDTLKLLWEKGKSFNLFDKYYRLVLWSTEMGGDYEQLIEVTKESENFLKAGMVNPLRFDVRHNIYTRTYAYLRIKDYENGIRYAKEGLEHIARSSRNWFSHMENYFLMALHSRNYSLAEEIETQVMRNPNMDKISPQAKERWELYKAYLYFMMPGRDVEEVVNFSNMYEKLPFYSQDKQGFMVAILILEFIDLLKKDRLDVALIKIPNTERYIYRYLNDNPESQREKLFLKLILIIVQSSFNPEVAAAKGQKYLKRLQITPEPGDAFAEVEIVPYEQLWQVLLEIMERAQVKLHVNR